jgi:hypothetical protein
MNQRPVRSKTALSQEPGQPTACSAEGVRVTPESPGPNSASPAQRGPATISMPIRNEWRFDKESLSDGESYALELLRLR